MLEYYETVLQISLKVFGLVGLNPKNMGKISVAVVSSIFSLMYSLIFLAFVYKEHTFSVMCEYIATLFIVNHHSILFVSSVAIRHHRLTLMEDMDLFWPIYDKVLKQETSEEFSRMLKQFKQILYVLFAYLVFAVGVVVPFLTLFKGGQVFKCYIPSFVPQKTIAVFETIYGLTVVPIMAGFDFYFLSLVFLLRMQFTILNKHLRMLSYDGREGGSLKSCVEHHNFLLRYLEEFQRIFSVSLLVFIWNEMMMTCFLLYLLTLSNNQAVAMNLVMLCFVQIRLLFIYFLPVHSLTEEIAQAVESVYFSDWYKSGDASGNKSMIVMIMVKFQKPTVISAGNLMPMNLQTCTGIFKTIFSFFTFLQNMKARH